MGGIQVPAQGSGDDGFDEEGYDESQRAEILEATSGGPSNGAILTDLLPDLGQDADADEDDLRMADDEAGEEDDDAGQTLTAQSEDELQEDFDEDQLEDDGDLDDADGDSLQP
ncbi:DNA primase [Sphingomonas soli]|uniref:DNA primase n=1 Tax=Sphingomonas soli TaxID=266127 RepID=UPI000834C4CA|nr:DNA primase [Sphingomonas soli]